MSSARSELTIRNDKIDAPEANELVQIFVLLAADATNSTRVRQSVDRVLPHVFSQCHRSSVEIARDLLAKSRELDIPLHGQVQVLLGIGCRSTLQQDVMRWYAIGCLLDDDLADIVSQLVHLRATSLHVG